MRILITGAAGFIGFSFSQHMAKRYKKSEIYCIDNLNSFYSRKYKLRRVKELKKHKNIKFIKADIRSAKLMKKIFLNYKINCLFNFAAQAGVRYSLTNPEKFISSNINGFFNLLELCKKYNVRKIFYASSSSVYGLTKKFPTRENAQSAPINVYSLSKEFNEKLSKIYFELYGLKSVGLRFFTVYGEWGRPDMFLFRLFKSSITGKKFELNNSGNHYRDFTYINDVNIILDKLLKNFNNLENGTYNICGSKSINIKKIIKLFKLKNPLNLVYKPKHKADLLKTHGSNKKLFIKIKKRYSFQNINKVLPEIFDWYKKNQIHKIT
tara:strand:- start:8770 stop:9738 length:969 start_codon:yes stop_codon:yes gene_type:complete